VSQYTTELIGRFFLVSTVGCTVILGVPGVSRLLRNPEDR
jgi:hypothetical protein